MALPGSVGKSPVLINWEVPGFTANRLMGAVQREAPALLAGDVAERRTSTPRPGGRAPPPHGTL